MSLPLEPTAPIMTVSEFRKVTGKDTAHFSDEEIAEIIQRLDLMAVMYFEKVNAAEQEAQVTDQE